MEGMFSVAKLSRAWHVRRVCVCACLALACGPAFAGQQTPTTLPPRIDSKAQALLDRAIQALGGPAFLRVKTLTTRGRVFAIEDESTVGLAPFTSAVEYPDKRRFSYGKKKPVILINNGEHAWELDRYGLTTQPPVQAYRWKISNRYSLENLLRLRIHEPGILIQAGGVDFVDNVPTSGVELMEVQGTNVKIDLNRQTFLPVRIRFRLRNPKTQEWEEFADVYGDYQNIQGVQTPMHITRYLDGQRVAETYRNAAQYDETYPADYFQPST